MQLNEFFQVLTLALMRARVPSNRIASLLREPIEDDEFRNFNHVDANSLLERHSPSLLTLTGNDWEKAREFHDKNIAVDVSMFCINDPIYPKYLKVIKDAPPILFVRGNKQILSSLPGVAIVGAREATDAGKEIARRIGKFMAENDWVVVSGLALGIDAAAHQGTLEAKGKTIAVLAGGLDKPNPARNAELGFNILEMGGAWISEHPVGVPPKKENFVPRNRIQVGLSAGSIIVEAKIKSGSLTQAKFCVGQNRPLFAVVPHGEGNPLKLNSEGTVHMVKDLGAIPISTREDYPKILSILNNQKSVIS